MPGTIAPAWRCDFERASPLFAPLHRAATPFAASATWPTIEMLNEALDGLAEKPATTNGHPIRFVAQAVTQRRLEEKYEPRIHLRGEVQTRSENWHDFFNALVWMTFPRTKATLNAQQYTQFLIVDRERRSNRTPVQDALTIFDEGGVIVASRDPELFDLLRRFAWKELFWSQRARVQRDMRFFLFGHALYEKALTPYKGITAKSVLLDVSADFFTRPLHVQLAQIDAQTAAWFGPVGATLRTSMLPPLPILGVPGWWPENSDPLYYDDKRYFRDHYRRTDRVRGKRSPHRR